jgi:HK97 family phage portal protein
MPLFSSVNTESQMRALSSEPTLYACVNRLASATSQVEWHLYRKSKTGEDEDRVEVTSHAALDLWEDPAPGVFTGQQFREVSEQHLELTGESYWVLGVSDRSPDLPLTLWPVRPDRMTPVPDSKRFIQGYIYTDPEGAQIPFPADMVVALRFPDPLDPYHGLGPVRALMTDLDAARFAAEWNRNFFMNSAEPGGVIEVPDTLSDDEFDELNARWNEQHQGAGNAHRIAILSNAMKWVPRSYSMRDLQFVELRKMSDEQIMLAFGLSKTLLGQTENVNRATAEAAEYVFGKYQVVPRLERFKQVLNRRVLPRYTGGDQLEFDYESPISGDSEAEARDRDSRVKAVVDLIGVGFDPVSVAEAFDLGFLDYDEKPAPALPPGFGPQQPPPAQEDAAAVVGAAVAAALAAGTRAQALPVASHVHHHPPHPWGWSVRPRGAADPPDLTPDELPDITRLQTKFEQVIEDLLEKWTFLENDQKQALIDQVLKMATSGSLSDLKNLVVDTEATAELLAQAMLEIGDDAADAIVEEAREQDVKIAPREADPKNLKEVALVVAGLVASRLIGTATSTALRANSPTATPEQVAGKVGEALNGLSIDGPRQQLSGALTGTQVEARYETILKAPEAALYAAEILDENTCEPCEAIDGKWLGNTSDIEQVKALYPGAGFGGYVDCKGRERCRGQVVAIWRPGRSR